MSDFLFFSILKNLKNKNPKRCNHYTPLKQKPLHGNAEAFVFYSIPLII